MRSIRIDSRSYFAPAAKLRKPRQPRRGYYNVRQVAELLGVSRATVFNYRAQPKPLLTAYRFQGDRKIWFPKTQVEELAQPRLAKPRAGH